MHSTTPIGCNSGSRKEGPPGGSRDPTGVKPKKKEVLSDFFCVKGKLFSFPLPFLFLPAF